MRTFIRAVEYWLPAGDRSHLEFGGGLYGSARRLAAVSPRTVFGRGEGLPGRAWEAGHPLVLQRLDGSYFRRADAALADRLTCGIAVPIFGGEFLSSVLVIFCGDDEAHAGAIEVWRNDPTASKDMTLADGYYGTTGEAFELMSRRMGFRRGHGLPGMVWDSGLPVFIDDLGHSARFLRADDARQVGINRGFALPCSTPGADHWVLAFLSALATPIVRRFEVWQPDASRERMWRTSGFCETAGALDGAPEGPSLERGQGSVGMTLLTGVPAVGDDAGTEPVTGPEARGAGLSSVVAIPVLRDGRLKCTVAWYF
ncbi:MAG: GAF domain-containing protein [Rubrivivax sp.]|nr:GAF domain-containing protein [Rubrivivax sp.]